VIVLNGKLPSPLVHPNLFGWAAQIAKFSPEVRASWPKGDDLRFPEGMTAESVIAAHAKRAI